MTAAYATFHFKVAVVSMPAAVKTMANMVCFAVVGVVIAVRVVVIASVAMGAVVAVVVTVRRSLTQQLQGFYFFGNGPKHNKHDTLECHQADNTCGQMAT